jgi:Protein of unknown function (DUF1194)
MRLRSLIFSALLLSFASLRAHAAQTVDLRLALAVDCSFSVSEDRFELQRHGYAMAFRSPQVLNAIRSGGGTGSIAVTLFQWTGYDLQTQIVPWTVIKDAAGAQAVADAIDRGPRQLFRGGTSISGAIDHAMTLFASSPYASARRTIDVSGDGSNNSGRPAEDARDAAVKQGVVVNGLPILTVEPDLDVYYRTHVVGGDGSFMIPARSFDAFAQAIQRKLIQEIAARPSGNALAAN